ncbi:ATP-binding protein [Catenovulum agarivorans]|uniref:ATP-binding protein n=1 Tax=Catenovulum agarivorans TaxID=1172192 RepID=UPI0002E31551|nr:ATP-binding protein [Catenovulum agarivorans]
MPSLQRIVLIDTHLPGVVELKLDGHTNICGTNASGKTTLQRLIPVFYGEFPSRVVPATRDSFEKWYLPRESSFIIYEYSRGDGQFCQTVLASSGNGVNYRLVDKAFVLEDYLQPQLTGDYKPVTMVELGRNLKREGINATSLLNTSQYRAIIQNDRGQLNQSSNGRELLAYARQFCLCEPDANLRHIEKLAKAVHSKEGKMETIKAMVSAILEEDGVTPPKSSLNITKVDDWIRECQLIQGFNQIKPEFEQLEQQHKQLQLTEKRLAQLKSHFSLDQSKLSKELIELEDQFNQSQIELKKLNSEWSYQQDKLNQTLSSARADVTQYETDLEQVESDYLDWQDKDIDSLQQKVTLLPQWQSQLETLNSRYQLLTDKHSDIESAYNKRLAEITEQHGEEIEAYRAEKDEVKEQLAEQKSQEQQQLQQLKQNYQNQLARIESEFKDNLHELINQRTEINSIMQHVAFTAHEQSELDLLDAQIKEAVNEEDHSRSQLVQVEQKRNSVQQKRQKAVETLNAAHKSLQQKQQAAEAIEKLLYPGQNTLLEFLRREQAGWEENLGKIIHPELLNRTDLKPQLASLNDSDNAEHAFGVLLDLLSLDTPEYAESEQALKAKQAQASDAVKQAKAQVEQAEQALAECSNELQQLESQLSQLKSDVEHKSQQRRRFQLDKDNLHQQYQHSLNERKSRYTAQLEQNKQAQLKLHNEKQACIDEIEEQRAEAELEHKAHWQQLLADLTSRISQVEQRIMQAQNNFKQDKQKCDLWLQNELSQRGVDVDEIGQVKKDIQQLQKDIRYVEQNRELVNKYQYWYQTVFNGHKIKWQQALAEAKQLQLGTERSLNQATQNYQQQRQKLNEVKTDSEQALRDAKQLEQELQQVLRELTKLKLAPSDPVQEKANLAQRINESREQLAEREELNQNVKHKLGQFDSLIAAQAGTGLAELWDRSREECTFTDSKGLRQVDHIKLVEKLSELINVFVPQKHQGLCEQGKIFGTGLTSYYQVLADIDKRIASQSKRLSKEVDAELYLDGISDSAVTIRSKISELEFWPELQQFHQLYLEWLEQGTHQLPSSDYAGSMRRVLDILGRAALTGGISKLLDIELRIKEGNSVLVIRTDRQLNESSSHGMAYLILCKFLLAFTRLLRGQSSTVIHWPIDELGTLHLNNIQKIFKACEQNNISIVGAFPNPESEILSLFDNRYLIDKQTRKLQIVQPRISPISQRIQQAKQAVKTTEETSA